MAAEEAKSRVVKAIEALQKTVAANDIGALDIVSPGLGATVGMVSQEIVPANGPRLVEIGNASTGAAVVYLQRNTAAVIDQGTFLIAGASKLIPLGNGQSLNAIATSANVKVSGQVYG